MPGTHQAQGSTSDVENCSGNPAAPYVCTTGCRKTFKKKGDWVKHEKLNWPQEIWICSHAGCLRKSLEKRIFSRRDNFRDHTNTQHSSLDCGFISNCERKIISSFEPCPFRSCQQTFRSWEHRVEHLAEEFKMRGRGLDKHSTSRFREDPKDTDSEHDQSDSGYLSDLNDDSSNQSSYQSSNKDSQEQEQNLIPRPNKRHRCAKSGINETYRSQAIRPILTEDNHVSIRARISRERVFRGEQHQPNKRRDGGRIYTPYLQICHGATFRCPSSHYPAPVKQAMSAQRIRIKSVNINYNHGHSRKSALLNLIASYNPHEARAAKNADCHDALEIIHTFLGCESCTGRTVFGIDGDIFTYLHSISPYKPAADITWEWFPCLASGLAYMHHHDIRHRHISPCTVVLRNGNVILAAYDEIYLTDGVNGETTIVDKHSATMCTGTHSQLRLQGLSSDLWSLGRLFLELLTVLLKNSISSLYDARSLEHDRSNAFSNTASHLEAKYLLSELCCKAERIQSVELKRSAL